MSRLRISQIWLVAVVLSAGLAVPTRAASTQTFTGKVSDTMCGAKHREGIPPADCVRACVQLGAKYVLVVADKVYTLDTSDQAALEQTQQAGLGGGSSHGHSKRRYDFGEIGDRRQVATGEQPARITVARR